MVKKQGDEWSPCMEFLLPVVRNFVVGISKVADHQPAFEIQEVTFMNIKTDTEFFKYGFLNLITYLLVVHIALISVFSDGHRQNSQRFVAMAHHGRSRPQIR